MGNTDKFEIIANIYDTPERIHIAKESADAIRKCLVDAKSKHAIDFGCGTGLVGLSLADEFHSMLFLDTSQGMIDQIKQKMTDLNIKNVDIAANGTIQTENQSFAFCDVYVFSGAKNGKVRKITSYFIPLTS